MDFISVEGNGMIYKDVNNNKNKEIFLLNLDFLVLKMLFDVQIGVLNDVF